MFKIKKSLFGQYESINIYNADKSTYLQIINGFGGIVNHFQVGNSPFSFIQGYANAEELTTKNPFFSRSAKLFPFPNRLNQGRYSYQGNEFQLAANFSWSEHAVHGLLYNQPLSLVDQHAEENFASVTLRFETDHLDEGYPFAFALDITYRVDASGQLSFTTKVHNTGTQTMPLGDAWHPYFNLGTSLDMCELSMSLNSALEQIDDLPTGNKEHHDRFDVPTSLQGIVLNNCFEFDNASSNHITLSRQDGMAKVEVEMDASYRFVQFYIPNSESTLAIEPMTCPADAFNNQMGLIHLEPAQQQVFTWHCTAQYLG
ncbi:aldose 1-epimerase [Vibrio parahaemolyticus]|nr:aldose 1-epimerase [Vibrio parahaemolyticus]